MTHAIDRRQAKRARNPALCESFFTVMGDLGFSFAVDRNAGRVVVRWGDLPADDLQLIQSEVDDRSWYLLDSTGANTHV